MYLDWQERDTYAIDIEADSLTPTVVWCMCWRNVQTNENGECTSVEEIKNFFNQTAGSLYVGHNILKFDAPVLVRLAGVNLSVGNCIDTLVLSTLYSPSITDGHSLGAWGQRLGEEKGEFNDWSRLSDEMLEYCHQDVLVTTKLFLRLMKTLIRLGFTEQSLYIQHRFTVILDRQQRNGFKFDIDRAKELYQHLRNREKELEADIHIVFPPVLTEFKTYKKAYKKDGTFNKLYEQHSLDFPKIVLHEDGSYTSYDYVEFNIGSPTQRVDKLISLGWKPEEFTEKGNPKPFDKGKLSPSLERFLEQNPTPEIELIARWMSINGRANMIRTWTENYNDSTGCIHGKLLVADTLRLRHQAPNTANIPAVRQDKKKSILYGEAGYYTYEARDLWCARGGRVLVGTDAAGLELRMLAHFLNRPAFTEQVVNGDPHQYNADTAGVTRPQAKTLIYAIQYGAAAPKVASIMGVSVKEGAYIRNMFLERLGLKELMEECQHEQRIGRVSLVDGSRVICPSPHAALNYKLQGSGARVMAASSVLAAREIRRNDWDVLKVGDIHDEDQSDSAIWCAEDFGRMRVQSIIDAGKLFNLNVPLDGEYKIGETWARTH